MRSVVPGGGDLEARFLSLWCPPAHIAGCSQMVWLNPAGKEGPALLRNYDYSPALLEGRQRLAVPSVKPARPVAVSGRALFASGAGARCAQQVAVQRLDGMLDLGGLCIALRRQGPYVIGSRCPIWQEPDEQARVLHVADIQARK